MLASCQVTRADESRKFEWILRYAQNDNITIVILSAAKNPLVNLMHIVSVMESRPCLLPMQNLLFLSLKFIIREPARVAQLPEESELRQSFA